MVEALDEQQHSYLALLAHNRGSTEAEISASSIQDLREWSNIVHPPSDRERIFRHAHLVADWRNAVAVSKEESAKRAVSITADLRTLCEAVDTSEEEIKTLELAEFLKILHVIGIPCFKIKAHLTMAFEELQPASSRTSSSSKKKQGQKKAASRKIKQENSANVVSPTRSSRRAPKPSARKREFVEMINLVDDNPAAFNSTIPAVVVTKKIKMEEDQFGEDIHNNVKVAAVPDAQGSSSFDRLGRGEEDEEEEDYDAYVPVGDQSSSTKDDDDDIAAASSAGNLKGESTTIIIKAGSVPEKILKALAEFRVLNLTSPTRTFVALFSGYSNTGSKSFANAVSRLKTMGLVEYPDRQRLAFSCQGVAEYGNLSQAAPTTNAEMHQRVLSILSGLKNSSPGKCREIFDQLKDGQAHAVKDVAKGVGYSNTGSKGFSNVVSRMSSIGILARPNKGELCLTDICYPFGRPKSENLLI